MTCHWAWLHSLLHRHLMSFHHIHINGSISLNHRHRRWTRPKTFSKYGKSRIVCPSASLVAGWESSLGPPLGEVSGIVGHWGWLGQCLPRIAPRIYATLQHRASDFRPWLWWRERLAPIKICSVTSHDLSKHDSRSITIERSIWRVCWNTV